MFPDPINSVRLLIRLTAARQGATQGDSQTATRQGDTQGDSQTTTRQGDTQGDSQTATRQGDTQGDSQTATRQGDTQGDSQTATTRLLSALANWGSKHAINSEDKAYFDDCLVCPSLSAH